MSKNNLISIILNEKLPSFQIQSFYNTLIKAFSYNSHKLIHINFEGITNKYFTKKIIKFISNVIILTQNINFVKKTIPAYKGNVNIIIFFIGKFEYVEEEFKDNIYFINFDDDTVTYKDTTLKLTFNSDKQKYYSTESLEYFLMDVIFKNGYIFFKMKFIFRFLYVFNFLEKIYDHTIILIKKIYFLKSKITDIFTM